MSLFDLPPKDTPRTLFGRDEELRDLVRLIDAGRWVVILGPRMVGKTSLLKSANHRLRRRSIYVNLWGARDTFGLMRALVHGMNFDRGLLSRIRAGLRRVEGVTIGPVGISMSPTRRPFRTMWDLVDLIGRDGGRTVIEFDEVQEISPVTGPFLRFLANILNSHPNVGFAFTGSYVGVLRTLLDPSGDSPLLGRPPARLDLGPFSEPSSVAFLTAGLREFGRSIPPEQLRGIVHDHLDGIPGWLTLFGNNVGLQKLGIERAIRATVAEGKRVVRGELGHFLEGRNRDAYWGALRVLASGASWTELRNALSVRRGVPVNDYTIGAILTALSAAGLVSHQEARYIIPDPMVRATVMEAGTPPGSPSSRTVLRWSQA